MTSLRAQFIPGEIVTVVFDLKLTGPCSPIGLYQGKMCDLQAQALFGLHFSFPRSSFCSQFPQKHVVTDGWQDGHVPNKPTHHVTAE
jgi:hypothetical protein